MLLQTFFRQHWEREQGREQAYTDGATLAETGDLEISLRQVSEAHKTLRQECAMKVDRTAQDRRSEQENLEELPEGYTRGDLVQE